MTVAGGWAAPPQAVTSSDSASSTPAKEVRFVNMRESLLMYVFMAERSLPGCT